MSKKLLKTILLFTLVFSLVLAACGPAATEEPAMTHTDRKGGWLDEIDVSVVSGESAITQLEAGQKWPAFFVYIFQVIYSG